MKKYLLLLLSVITYGQTYQNPTYGTVTTKTNTESATATRISAQETSGLINWLQPINIPIPIVPTNYTVATPTLGAHLTGIDNKLGTVTATTAGISTRVWFTADQTTITAGTFDLTNATSKGTAPSHIQSVVNDDNQKKYFTTDLIGTAFATATLFPPGTYAGNLSASTTPNSAQQRWTVELYKCDTNGTPIASGVSGAAVGSLGVTVIVILDSGLLTLADGSVTNVQVSGTLPAGGLSVAVGERIRYHVSAEKVGTAASNITQSVYYGTSYNSFLDVPVPLNTSGVQNLSTVAGQTTTEALNALNASNMQKWYLNSASPQITTTAGLGALTIQRGSASDTDNIIAGRNGAGTVTSSITGAGVVTGLSHNSTGSISASGAIARGNYINNTLNATLNNDVLVGLDINPTFNNGAFTGVTRYGMRIGSVPSGSQLSLGGTSSGGTISFNRGTDGTVGAFLGYTTPSSIATFELAATSGSTDLKLTGSTVSFTTAGLIQGRFSATTGNFILQNGGTFTDNGVDRLQVTGTVLSQGYKVTGTTGYLKSDGTVDTDITSTEVSNASTVVGTTTTDALNTLNTGKVNISGTGTTNFFPMFNGANSVINSPMSLSGSIVGLLGLFSSYGGTGDTALYNSEYRLSRTSSTGNFLQSKIALVATAGDTSFGDMVFKVKTTASSGESEAYFTDAITIKGSNATVKLKTLEGTGTRQVVADASGNLSATTPQPLKYVALLTQSGTSAPVATVLENTLGGTVVWTYSGVGTYTGTLTGAFTNSKTTVIISDGFYNGNHAISRYAGVNSVTVHTITTAGAFIDNAALNNSMIEIRVYP